MLQRFILLAVLVLTRSTLADGFGYSIVGNGCVPDHTIATTTTSTVVTRV